MRSLYLTHRITVVDVSRSKQVDASAARRQRSVVSAHGTSSARGGTGLLGVRRGRRRRVREKCPTMRPTIFRHIRETYGRLNEGNGVFGVKRVRFPDSTNETSSLRSDHKHRHCTTSVLNSEHSRRRPIGQEWIYDSVRPYAGEFGTLHARGRLQVARTHARTRNAEQAVPSVPSLS
jgi:hypothetical protein